MHAWMMKQKPPAWLYPCQEEGSSSPLSLHSSQAWLRMWSLGRVDNITHCPSCSRSPASSLCLCQWARCVLQSLQHDIQFHILRPLEIKHFNWIHNTHTYIHKRENIVKSWVTFCSVRYLPRRMGDMAVMLLRIPTRFPYPLNIFELNFVFFQHAAWGCSIICSSAKW